MTDDRHDIARIRRDPLAMLAGFAVGALVVFAALRGLADVHFPVLVHYMARVPLGILALVALFRGNARRTHPEGRRFWRLLGTAVALELFINMIRLPQLDGPITLPEMLLEDALYLASFLALMFASYHEPDRRPGWSAGNRELRLNVATACLAFGGMFVYFVLTTAWFDTATYRGFGPSYIFFVTAQFVLCGRLLYLAGTSPSRRWRTIWLLVACGVALWMLTDLAAALELAGWSRPVPAVMELVRYLPYALFIWAALVRDRVALPERRHQLEGFRDEISWRVSAANAGLVIGLFAFHLTLRGTPMLGTPLSPARDLVAIVTCGAGIALCLYQGWRTPHPQEPRDTVSLVLTEAEFTQARRMQALGHLAGSVVHDFNNLLMVMRGSTELLRGRVDAGADDRLDDLDSALSRADGLIAQLRAINPDGPPDRRSTDLQEVLGESRRLLGRVVPDGVRMRIRSVDDLDRVGADPTQLSQVVFNLAINAFEAMPDGGRLTIDTSNVELETAWADGHEPSRPRRCVLLSVRDTGRGIDPAIRDRIFEPFVTTKRTSIGTGLGLATVYGIVTRLGGHIAVDSEPGRGTTFDVFLPRVAERAPSPPAPLAKASEPRRRPRERRPELSP